MNVARRNAIRSLSRCLSHSRQASSADPNILRTKFQDITLPKCSFNDYLWQNLDRWPDKTAVVCGVTGRGFTYAQTHRMSTSLAAALRSRLRLPDESVVAIMLPNLPEYPCAALGVLQAGYVATTVNPIYTAFEVKRQLEMTKSAAVITSNISYPAVSAAVRELGRNVPIIVVRNGGDLPEGTIDFAELAEDFSIDTTCLKSVERSGNDLAFLPFSSGTTGMPKGVRLSHANIIAANQMIIDDEIVAIQPTTETHQDSFPAVLPFFHIYGLVVVLLNQMLLGCKLVTLPSFNPETFLKTLVVHKTSALFCVPPIAVFLGKHPAVTAQHLQYLRSIVCGAAPLSGDDAEAILVKNKNMIIRQGYGLTETTSVSTICKKSEMNYSSVGFPVAECEMKIVDVDTGASLGSKQNGELWVRGPHVMLGYLENPEADAEVFREGGWYRTGDIAQYDDRGYIYITDRLKELIKVKGFQVPPAELEAILRTHPKVLDAAVIGVPDPISGEVPKAFIVPQPKVTVTEEEIKEFLNPKVAKYKQLRGIKFVESIPKNAAGKILRKQLKEQN